MLDFSVIGWIGAFAFVIAYFLLSIKVLSAEKVTYHALNAFGGICLVINSVFLDDTPNFFVNFIWTLIAVFSIYRILRMRKKINL